MDELKKDTRFAHITKDPRFRPASKKESKLKIDRRFASMFNDPKFKLKYTVDKRGRPLVREHTTRDDMKKFYHLDDEDESSATSSDEETTTKDDKKKKKRKPITGDEGLDEMLKSDESEEDEDEEDDEEEDEEDEEKEEEEESSSSEDDEDAPEDDDEVEWNDFDEKCTRSEDVSRRLAVCNMDWDRVRAVDIFILLNSWKPPNGVIKSVTIYPSEYGIKQMTLEKEHGPLPGTTKPIEPKQENATDSGHQSEAEEEPEDPEIKSDDDDDNADPQNFNEDDDPDTTNPAIRERLRKYQLNRLKYYYAVVECDTVETATKIYEECDGLEYETSAVRLDLRFVPDDVKFDPSIPPHDQCTELPDKSVYKPILFRNTALTQTKVRCTWDETPVERRRLLKKNYTLEELEKVDLDAYLASESDDDLNNDDDDENAASDLEDDEEQGAASQKKKDDGVFKVPTIPAASRKSTKDQPIARAPSVMSSQDDIDRYRALLLDFNDDPKKDKKSKKKLTNFFDEKPSDEEDEDGEFPRNENPDDDESDASDIDMEITWQPGLKGKGDDKLEDTKPKKDTKKNKKDKKNGKSLLRDHQDEEDEQEEDAEENHQESLELLTVDDDVDQKRDYNLRQMMKEHKKSLKAEAKKSKKKSKQGTSDLSHDQSKDDAFQLNVNDQRFQAVYIQPAFNIDQSDPRYRATAGTQKIIDEKLKKRKLDQRNGSTKTENQDDDLVSKLKRKAAKKDE